MSCPDGPDEKMLARAVKRAGESSALLLAAVLAEWTRAFDGDASEALGLDRRRLDELALCRRPRPDHWLADARLLAGEFGIEPGKLIALLRAGETAEALRYAHPVTDGVSGRLLAARDRDEDEGR